MRASLCLAAVAAVLALCLWPASAGGPPRRARHEPTSVTVGPDHERLQYIKEQILAKLGREERPRPVRAPPRDVVRQILTNAADAAEGGATRHMLARPAAGGAPPRQYTRDTDDEDDEERPREIIAIAKRGLNIHIIFR